MSPSLSSLPTKKKKQRSFSEKRASHCGLPGSRLLNPKLTVALQEGALREGERQEAHGRQRRVERACRGHGKRHFQKMESS